MPENLYKNVEQKSYTECVTHTNYYSASSPPPPPPPPKKKNKKTQIWILCQNSLTRELNIRVVGFVLKKLTYFEMLIVPHALQCVYSCFLYACRRRVVLCCALRPSVRPPGCPSFNFSCPLYRSDTVQDIFIKLGTNINRHQTMCKEQEPTLHLHFYGIIAR